MYRWHIPFQDIRFLPIPGSLTPLKWSRGYQKPVLRLGWSRKEYIKQHPAIAVAWPLQSGISAPEFARISPNRQLQKNAKPTAAKELTHRKCGDDVTYNRVRQA